MIRAAERDELVRLRLEALHAMADKRALRDAPNGAFDFVSGHLFDVARSRRGRSGEPCVK